MEVLLSIDSYINFLSHFRNRTHAGDFGYKILDIKFGRGLRGKNFVTTIMEGKNFVIDHLVEIYFETLRDANEKMALNQKKKKLLRKFSARAVVISVK